MKYFMLIALTLSFIMVGCTPKLANRELGPEEKEWKEYLEEMYPGWEMPGTLPPAISDRYDKNTVKADNDVTFINADKNQTDLNAAASDSTVSEKNDVALTDNAEPDNIKVRYEEYTVEKDDSLSLIAKKVYGNGRKYHRIYKANEDLIKNQNKIYPGMKLRIPRP